MIFKIPSNPNYSITFKNLIFFSMASLSNRLIFLGWERELQIKAKRMNMKGRKPGKLPNQKGLFYVVCLFKPSASFVMLYCQFEMGQPQQVLEISLQIPQGCNINSRTTYVEARSTAFVSLLGYLLSLLMESSSKLQLDMIYLKTLALIWNPILSSAFLRRCQQSGVFVIQT